MSIFNFFDDFNKTVETLRQCYISLSLNKKEVIEKSVEFQQNLASYNRNKEYFIKSSTGKSIIGTLDEKFEKFNKSFTSFLREKEKEQKKLEKAINSIYKSNPDLIQLGEYSSILSEDKFNQTLVVLSKAFKNNEISKEKLLELKKYKRVDFEKGFAYVKDNRTHYGDCIVFNELNEILFLKRNKLDDFEATKYCLPGGHVEDGEDFQYAALRELEEETGIKCEAAIPSGEYSDNKVVIHYFTVQVEKDKCNVFLDEREHQQFEWVPMEDLSKYPLIKNLDKNFEDVILIPTWVINRDLAPNILQWDNSGKPLRDEVVEKMILANDLYKSFRGGDIEIDHWKNYTKENDLEVQPFTLYKSTSKPLYGLKLTNSIEKSEKIEGGLADGETVEELAAHHKTSIKKIYDEIEIGKKVEMEHTDDPKEALEITMDHLWEIPDYYTRLKEMEKEAKEDKLEKAYSHKYLRREGTPGNYKYYYADELGNESSYEETDSVLDRIIKGLEEPIQQITEKIEEYEFKKTGRSLTPSDKKIIRYSLLSDMTSALGKYTEPGDELEEFKVITSKKGSFKINLFLTRDGQKHFLTTDAIYAGGYNVQKLHYRYLTNTSLPITKSSVPNKYTEELKKLKREEKIEKDISDTKSTISRLQQKIDQDKSLTDDQILEKNEYWQRFKDTTWDILVERGSSSNFENKEAFEISQTKYRQSIIDHFKTMITLNEESITSMKKTVDKLEKKLEKGIEDELEKGKAAEIGEIREWSGVKMQKTAQGWTPVKHDSKTSNKENGGNPKSVEKTEEQKEYSEKELEEFARKSSEEGLKTAAAGGDEKLRVAAKKELDRREREEVPGEDKEDKIIEKLRSLSDEQIKFYLDAPYEDIKRAAKFIVDERGLTIKEKFEPITFSGKASFNRFFKSFSQKSLETLSFEEQESLILYRADSGPINDSLRFGGIENRNIKKIDSVFEKNLFKLDSDIIAYRGIKSDGNTDFFGELKSGDIFQDKGFVSTTVSKSIGVDFLPKKSLYSDNKTHSLLEIRVKRGQNIIPMQLMGEDDSRVEMMNEEYEILLNRDSKFKVIEVKKEVIEGGENRGEVNKIIVELI